MVVGIDRVGVGRMVLAVAEGFRLLGDGKPVLEIADAGQGTVPG